MSGRAYTMKEMKGIVEHLVENKCYGDYRGRKMWVDFAASGKTSRTWQSLKETFIKRILPDIQNPYYKLHLDQIRSFRVGEDVTGKPKNKLEFRTATEDSSNDQEMPSTSKTNEANKASGETSQASSNRDSVETIILSTEESAPTKKDETPRKRSLRDCIQFADDSSAPIIRDILRDFSSSDEEPKENQDDTSKKPKFNDSTPTKNRPTDEVSTNEDKKGTPSKKSLRLKKKKESKNENGTTQEDSQSILVIQEQNKTNSSPNKIVTDGKQDISADKSRNIASGSMPDSLLPNNPEELKAIKNNIPTRKSNETVEKPKSRNKTVDSANSDNAAQKVTKKTIKDTSESSDSKLNNLPKNNSPKEVPFTPKKNDPINAVVTTIVVKDSEEQDTEENKLTTSQSNNPCLQSVSLFAEQYLQANSDSDTDTNANKNKNSDCNAEKVSMKLYPIVLDKNEVPKEVVMLKSHSESESEDKFQPSKQGPSKKSKPRMNSKIISNLFGSSSGGVNRKRQRTSSHHSRVDRHNVLSSGSSEWTSESDSEAYVSPPRSRNRLTRKCLKPQSARILSLEEHGGLFVVSGKKVFPVITDRTKPVKCLSEADSDKEKESYWQLKYVEERKKTAELTKLLQNLKNGEVNQTRSRNSVEVQSPVLPTTSLKNQESIIINDDNSEPEEVKDTARASTLPAPREVVEEEKPVKIKFAKNNEEVQLEGHWRSLHPILGDVMQMFKRTESTCAITEMVEAEDVHKKVDALEAAIFKEIEDRDAKERLQNNEETDKNVTERRKRGRPKGTPSPRPAASKRQKGSTESTVSVSSGSDVLVVDAKRSARNTKPDVITNIAATSNDVTPTTLPKTRSSTKQKLNGETPTVQRRKSTSREIKINDEASALQRSTSNKRDPKKTGVTSKQKTDGTENYSNTSLRQLRKTTAELKDDGVATPNENDASLENNKVSVKENKVSLNENKASVKENKASLNENKASVKENKASIGEYDALLSASEASVSVDDSQILYKFPSPEPVKRPLGRPRAVKKYSRATPKIYSATENIFHQSADSSQGYQDSDHSPLSGQLRTKKKFSLPTNLYKTRKYSRMQRRKTLTRMDCDASSESSNLSVPAPANITIRNSSLSSDVYRSESYQQLMPHARSFHRLEKITESSPCPNVVDSKQNSLNLSPASQVVESDFTSLHAHEPEVGSSSNVSLPMSPELSFVETISVNKDTLSGNFPTINETQENRGNCDSQYQICDVNVAVPLMEQDCTFKMNYQNRQSVSQLSVDRNTQCPDSIDIDTTEVIPTIDKGVTVSQSLLDKIGTVSIETQTTNDSLDMRLGNLLLESAKKLELQNKMIVDDQSIQTDAMAKLEQKPKAKSRKRCSTPHKRKVPKKSQTPKDPVIEEQMEFCAPGRKSCPPVVSVICAENTAPKPKVATRKPRRAKQIIKVKITRPKPTKQGKKCRSTLSIPTDSGINDTTASILHSLNSSVRLIHNHSETCLHAQECLHSSVEFVENTPQSVISLDTSSVQSADNKENLPLNVDGDKSLRAQFYSTDAQDASSLTNVSGLVSRASLNSLLTDDLTSPPALSPSTWHLLSEDEDTLAPPAKNIHFGDPTGCAKKRFSDPNGCAKNIHFGDPNSFTISNNFGDLTGCVKNDDFGDPTSCTMSNNFSDPTSCIMSNNFGDPAECNINNNFVHPTGCAKTVGYGSNLNQLFSLGCAVPDLSTITEQSRETDCNSLGFKMDTNTRNEFLALDLLAGNQEEFFTCPSDM